MSKIIELQPREINSIGGGKAHNPFDVGVDLLTATIGVYMIIADIIERAKVRPGDKPNCCAESVGFFAGYVAAGVVLTGGILYFA